MIKKSLFLSALFFLIPFSSYGVNAFNYTSFTGAEAFNARAQYINSWRRTQALVQDISTSRYSLLSIGFPGKSSFGNNISLRLSVSLEKPPEGRFDPFNPPRTEKPFIFDKFSLKIDNTLTPSAVQPFGGLCYDISEDKKDCFELETDGFEPFGDFYGSGGRFDPIFLQALKPLTKGQKSSVVKYDGTKFKLADLKKPFEPFDPSTFYIEPTFIGGREAYKNSLLENRNELAFKEFISAQATPELDAGSDSLAISYKNALYPAQFPIQRRMVEKLINKTLGLRDLTQLASHLSLSGTALQNYNSAKQAVGGTRSVSHFESQGSSAPLELRNFVAKSNSSGGGSSEGGTENNYPSHLKETITRYRSFPKLDLTKCYGNIFDSNSGGDNEGGGSEDGT